MESNYDKKWFQVSLRLCGDNLPVDEIETRLGVKPSSTGKRGEYIKGNLKYAKYPTNIWVWAVTEDSSMPFEEQIENLLDVLEIKREALMKILRLSGVEGELFLGFSSNNGQGGAYFSAELLSRIGALGLALTLDLYPPTPD